MADLVTLIPYDEEEGVPGDEGITIDVTESEEHNEGNDVTSFPIEVGGFLNDHTAKKPITVRISGFFSYKAPGFFGQLDQFGQNLVQSIDEVGETFGLRDGPVRKADSRALELWDKLLIAKDADTRWQLITSLRVYYNMMVESLVAKKTTAEGDSVSFEISFRQVRFAVTDEAEAIVEATPVAPPAAQPVKVGKVAPKADRKLQSALRAGGIGDSL